MYKRFLLLSHVIYGILPNFMIPKHPIMNIAISGSGGFVGKKLSASLIGARHEVLAIPRHWFSLDHSTLADNLKGAECVIHLAGAPILRRWTKSNRKAIYDSRINTTQQLTRAMAQMKDPPHTFICASAVGIYPETGVHDENSRERASDFLGEVCTDWELAASRVPSSCRQLSFRFGVILGNNGGALGQMLLPFKLGLGGRISHGKQMMPWIHMDDVTGIFQFVLDNSAIKGPVNITTPNPVSNLAFTRTLAKTLKRPAFMPVPEWALKLAFGQGATVLTRGQTVVPGTLTKAGYPFRFHELEAALWDLIK